MQTTAIVIKTNKNRAVVEVERQTACDGCHKNKDGSGCSICSLTGASKKFEATALNQIGASVGDKVTVTTKTERVLGYAALVFLLPLVVGVAFYFLASRVFYEEIWQYVSLIFGFVISFFFVWLYAKSVANKRCDVEIVEILEKNNEGQ
ncbi:MAG: SoxR reducing system RseC family protein [Clostridia bacterium]|nr:SoxR reducing system RseC family protein [Clostridia bacterium]